MHLLEHVSRVVTKAAVDPHYRMQVLSDPNKAMRDDGADIGQSHTSMEWNNKTNTLDVHVAKGGANWHGAINLTIEE